MFVAITNASWGFIACGIIWSIACGFAAGNYACSLVYRLPRGKLLLDKTPYCGNCGALLKVKDLFPVISALLLGHRCRYCQQPFPVSHTWTELAIGLIFVLAFLQWGFGEAYVMLVLLGVFLVTITAIEANENAIMTKLLVVVAVVGMLNRTLMDHSIFGFVLGGLYGLLAAAFIWRKSIQKIGHIYVLPPRAHYFAIGALCAGDTQFLNYILLVGLFEIIRMLLAKQRLSSLPISLAIMIIALYPHALGMSAG